MSKSCGVHRATHDRHLDHCKSAEATGTQLQECTQDTQVANKRSSRKLENMAAFQVLPESFTDEERNAMTFLKKLRSRITGARASETFPCRRNPFEKSLLSGEILVREFVRLARIIRQTAAVCFSPSSAADEDCPPYMQLDKVTHALPLRREAFGPLYLVT
ncbi:hypothetical protein GUJ93_ZPchr0006g46430 [Zizania palustris]|uniref:Uncharacterized protein n=1 Tax=Zizania palustris TaxID=103762 RepID=A0A8J5W3Q4_ZIZPA|nr:hypothetical protein GUJ93_ZPchr0006g46430 [Zizania palustris]KAG8073730.1 hypothetical protein GUJ93_ZPchr0006g46430 [Zizania palustris]